MAGGDPAQLTDPSLRVNQVSPIPSLNAIYLPNEVPGAALPGADND
jgi:hypothetical protein